MMTGMKGLHSMQPSESLIEMSMIEKARRNGKQFINPVPTSVGGLSIMFKVLWRYLTGPEERIPKRPLGPFRTDARIYDQPPMSGLRVTWMGHSSTLLEIDGVRVLMDPVWEQRAAPVEWFGPKRFFAPPLPLEELPPIDVVLFSHDHYDHLGARTVRRLTQLEATAGALWVTPLGVGEILKQWGVKQAHELAGRIALAQKDYDKTIAELQQANLQDPRNVYRLSLAYQAKGDSAKAHEMCKKAAEFNSLPQLNYAFIRTKAQKMVGGKA